MADQTTAAAGDAAAPDTTGASTAATGTQMLDVEPVQTPDQATPTQEDFKARFQADPGYAWEQYNELRAKHGDVTAKAKAADPLMELARWAGGGDVTTGVPLVQQLVSTYANIASNPQMKAILDHYSSTGNVPDSYLDLDQQPIDNGGLDPAANQRFTDLDNRNQRLESRLVQREMRDFLDEYFRADEIGRHLLPEEQGEVLREMHATITRAAQNPAQRSLIDNLNLETVANIATAWVRKEGKFGEISDRMQRARAETRQSAATETPSGLSTSGVPTQPDYGNDHLKAIEAMARDAGVDLWKPQIR